VDTTAHPREKSGGARPQHRRGVSLELKTTAVVAATLTGLFLVVTRYADAQATWPLAIAVLVAFVVIAAAFDVLIYRTVHGLIRRSRSRLGGAYERGDPYYRDEVRELGHLVGALISVLTAAEDKESASQGIRDDLMRLRSLNRQLMDLTELGKEMNSALPYRETVDRVLSRSKTFLRADFAALLLLDPEAHAFSLEGAQGVLSPTLSVECCAHTADCPVRQAIADGRVVRMADHACSLFPNTMTAQVVIPVAVENAGDMALLATATSGDYLDPLSNDVLEALRNHVQGALSNAHKHDAIRRQVITDHLTGLYNRRYFMKRAGEEIQRSLRHQDPLSVLMVDIDHFKQFNDVYGHATGDRVLQTVARAIQDALRGTDICSRHGGEEFAVMLPKTPGDSAYFVADRVRRRLGATRYTGLGLPADASVTISVGAATCPRDATTLDELMELADKALYQAKHGGRDRVVLWGDAEREPVRR